jgi:hypothetical protein
MAGRVSAANLRGKPRPGLPPADGDQWTSDAHRFGEAADAPSPKTPLRRSSQPPPYHPPPLAGRCFRAQKWRCECRCTSRRTYGRTAGSLDVLEVRGELGPVLQRLEVRLRVEVVGRCVGPVVRAQHAVSVGTRTHWTRRWANPQRLGEGPSCASGAYASKAPTRSQGGSASKLCREGDPNRAFRYSSASRWCG